jgi:lipoteichoic acid synthase
VVRDYYNSMSYVDKSLEYFINSTCHLKNTYIIIIGDHTPSISNDTFKQASFYMDNKYFEFVPLLILTPDKKIYKENNISASFLDIAPTILYSSNISFKIRSDGINLLTRNNIGQIPFKGKAYDRAFLFKRITSEQLAR